MTLQVFIGWDSREMLAYQVAVRSLLEHAAGGTFPMRVVPLIEHDLRARRLYRRPHERRNGQLYDVISEAPMSTEFAITRFLVPALAEFVPCRWAIFCDCDFLFRRDIFRLFPLLDESKALMCVQHDHRPAAAVKMDGQAQTAYPRKNWSSFMAFNLFHPATKELTVDMVNGLPGRDLHRFCWLNDSEIGALPVEWNWLEGHSDPAVEPAAVHFTAGTPDMLGNRGGRYSDEWAAVAREFGWRD